MNPYAALCSFVPLPLVAVVLVWSQAAAGIPGPYSPDADTLHLWHFDDAGGPASDSVGGVALNAGNGATLGGAGFSGFGGAGDTSAGDNADFLSASTQVPPVGAGGAFTYEAMINVSTISADIQQIFTMDGNSSSLADRPFQFRLRQGQLQFVNIAGASGNDNDNNATIPTTGDDAFVAGEWFHVAVTYNGEENTADNLKLYWTRVDVSRTQANLIGSFTLVDDLSATAAAVYGVGNDGRTTGTAQDKNIEGLIDEVRISGVARAADGMLFGGPDLTPPLITSLDPDGATGVYPGSRLVATFSENIALTGAGTITIRDQDTGDGDDSVEIVVTDASQVTVSDGVDLIITPPGNLAHGTPFEVVIDRDAVVDQASTPNRFAGTNSGRWTFTTAPQDATAPILVGKIPADDATEVPRGSNLVATFDDDLVLGGGSIVIRDLDGGAATLTIDVTDASQVSVSGKELVIHPAVPLAQDRNYAVQIEAGAVKNFSDLPFAGIPETDETTWTFRTRAVSPNVIFILGDDQGWYDYGFMQRPGVDKAAVDLDRSIPQVVKTPALDRLADEGLAYIHGYSAPVCRPALASIITGTYMHQHRVTGNDLVNSSGTRIDDTTVEARMQVLNPLPRTLVTELGYTCFQTGKWWEGHHTNGGFTHGDTANSVATGTEPPQWSGGRPSYVRARHGDWGLMTGRVDYVNDVAAPAHPIPYANTVRTVTDFIDAQVAGDQPFFLWYAPFLPHDPFDPPAGLVAEYTALGLNSTDAKYYANIERFDGGVGAILDHLDARGIADHTLIIMICDNGRALDLATVGKLTPYESGVRSPILVRWPDRIKPGGAIEPQVVRTPVSLVDMVPTVHHALGLPTFPEMKGIDLLDPAAVASRGVVCGEDHDVEIFTLSDPTESLESRFAVRDGWKLILFTSGNRALYQLYDGARPVDPHETTNLASAHPQLVSELTMEIINWYAPEPNDFGSWISDPALGIDLADRGFDGDPDGDGLVNGVEAWFGTHPGVADPGLGPVQRIDGDLQFIHPRNPNAPADLRGSYEWSPNLVDWYAGDGVAGPGGGAGVTISAIPGRTTTTVIPTAGAPMERLFIRAAVILD